MSCGCQTKPCSCSPCTCQATPCNCCPAPPRPCTYCDRDRKNNVWVEGIQDENGNGGICMLDTMTEAQIISVIECDPVAREDLKRVTSDPYLLELAERLPSLPTEEEGDKIQREMGRHADSIPFYSFRGFLPYPQ